MTNTTKEILRSLNTVHLSEEELEAWTSDDIIAWEEVEEIIQEDKQKQREQAQLKEDD